MSQSTCPDMFVRLLDLAYRLDKVATRVLSPFGVSLSEYRVLAVLEREDGRTAFEIIPHVSIDQSNVSRTLQRLYDKGWVSRRRSRQDRRVVRLTLTGEGKQQVRQMSDALQNQFDEMLRGTSVQELDQGIQLMEALVLNAEKNSG